MKITTSKTRRALVLEDSSSKALILKVTYIYKDGSRATCRKFDGPFADRASAAHFVALYHHIQPTMKQLPKNVWKDQVRYNLMAGPGHTSSFVDQVIVRIFELDVPITFFYVFEPERLAEKK